MKKKHSAIFILLLGLSFLAVENLFVHAQGAPSDSSQTLYLKDGSVLRGKLIAVEGDSYVIETDNMGVVKVRSSHLAGMSTANQPGTGMAVSPNTSEVSNPNNISSSQFSQMQNQMMADPEIMRLIQELASDPAVQESFADKSLIADIATMDPELIQANPNAQKLMTNPTLQKIIQLMQEKNQRR